MNINLNANNKIFLFVKKKESQIYTIIRMWKATLGIPCKLKILIIIVD